MAEASQGGKTGQSLSGQVATTSGQAAVAALPAVDSPQDYERLYRHSTCEGEAFWAEQARCIDWLRPFEQVKNVSYATEDLHIRWYEDGLLNVCVNCVDRHLATRRDKTAILWQGDAPADTRSISYGELHTQVCRLANGLQAQGIDSGDRVVIYMPMVPEAVFAMLACARIGAVHSVVFGGFSANALADRIIDCGAKMVITADAGVRGGKSIPLKANVDAALARAGTECVDAVLVLERSGADIAWQAGRDIWYHELVARQADRHSAAGVGAEHPLFVLYTSGSTGKPKGLQHCSGGYLVYAAATFRYVFDYREDDVYWCTADIGWITGHSYVVYGPLANGATTVMFEGVPNYPDLGRFGQIIDRYRVSLFYTAPTAVRTLMSDADAALAGSGRDSLRLLACAGEPINPGVWRWYSDAFGNGRCPVIDTWWQTETGGVMIAPLPKATALKPGSATRPFFGIEPQLVDANSDILTGAADGHLVILDAWPGQARTIWGDHQRFIDTYFSTHPGMYFTGDGARRDADGDYWITGRVDDVLNVSGHRLGTAEIESATVSHPAVAEAAVVGFPHPIKGEAIYIYATPVAGIEANTELTAELCAWVRKELGPVATPDRVQWTPGLPKTRSGKIMRRILRKIAADDFASLGDTSTLAEPGVVEELIAGRLNRAAAGN
ncbi:acetate--CoA ligase [Exilibacterium tricleocarpae]|uniref:Acetyl-coenzyme A synthetase n=1 Tax=Exilibacterium tricleocarpae TaxID=2591008 RepID=A0A545U871_9GAMM|nr:acetate--CoA ligase [Exilibacterium tricleocarpae]TQV85661.1 acetate--CoA ligase [Exilibacterium tricleocarpae]